MVHYFKTYFVTKDPLKLNIAINTCLQNAFYHGNTLNQTVELSLFHLGLVLILILLLMLLSSYLIRVIYKLSLSFLFWFQVFYL